MNARKKICRWLCIVFAAIIWPLTIVEWSAYYPNGSITSFLVMLLLVAACVELWLGARAEGRRLTKMETLWLTVSLAAAIHPMLRGLLPAPLASHDHCGSLYPLWCEICGFRVIRMYIIPWSMVTLKRLLSEEGKIPNMANRWDRLCLFLVPVAVAGMMQWFCYTEQMGVGAYAHITPYTALDHGGAVVFVIWAAVRPLLFLLDRFLLWYKTRRQTTSNIFKET